MRPDFFKAYFGVTLKHDAIQSKQLFVCSSQKALVCVCQLSSGKVGWYNCNNVPMATLTVTGSNPILLMGCLW